MLVLLAFVEQWNSYVSDWGPGHPVTRPNGLIGLVEVEADYVPPPRIGMFQIIRNLDELPDYWIRGGWHS